MAGAGRPCGRWILRVALACAALAVSAGVAGLASWRSQSVRQAALRRAAAWVERRTGLAVSAADVALRPATGVVELSQVRVGVPDAPPFLTVAHLALHLEPASLARGAPVIRLLRLQAPHLHLDAPLPPRPPGQAATPAPTLPPVVVEQLLVVGGSVSGGGVPVPARPYLSAWRLDALRAAGSYRDGRLRLSVRVDRLALEGPAVGHRVASVALHGEVEPGASWVVPRAEFRTAGLSVEASGRGSLAGGDQQAQVRLHARLAELAPALELEGEAELEAAAHGPPLEGELRLAATGVPVAAARRLLPPAAQAVVVAGSEADLFGRATFRWPSDDRPQLAATLQATWRQEAEPLLAAAAELDVAGTGARLALEASLLPGHPGTRHVAGTVYGPGLAQPASLRLAGVNVEVAEADLAATVAELRRIWPELLAAVPPDPRLAGTLAGSARLDGPLPDPTVTASLRWRPPAGGLVAASVHGQPRTLRGEGTVRLEGVEMAAIAPQVRGTASGQLELHGSPQDFLLRFDLQAEPLAAPGGRVDVLRLAGETNGRELRLDRVAAALGGVTVAGSARADLALPLRDAQAQLHLTAPAAGLLRADLTLRLEEGVLTAEIPGGETLTGPVWAVLTVPLGALRPLLGDRLAGLPLMLAQGPVVLHAAAPGFDTCALAPLLPVLDRPERVQAGVEAFLSLDPDRPTGVTGEITLAGLELSSGALRVQAPSLRVTLDGGRATLVPFTLAAAGTTLEAGGEVALAEGWHPRADPPAAAVRSFTAWLRGRLETALLEPYLGGARASGPLALEASLEGTPAAPRLAARLDGSGTSLLWLTPYAARLEAFSASAQLSPEGDAIFSAAGDLNGGRLQLTGARTASGQTEVQVELAGTRFRLDFGVLVEVSGELIAEMPPVGRSRVHGTLQVARGRLDRPLSFRHEVVPFLLAPKTGGGTAGGALDLVDLDVAVVTQDGVRVRNNLADLRVRWENLAIRGTAWNPHLEGVVSVDPGGVVRAVGQTLRLDRAVATFTGDPLRDPLLDLAVTSSLDDPRVGRTATGALQLLEEDEAARPGDPAGALATAAASAVGASLAASLSESLGGAARVSVEPVLVFGEADPSARLTLARDLNPQVAFALSLDLRNADRQTYLLDLHNLPKLPTLTAQVFTNDAGNSGVTLQQTLEFRGAKHPTESTGPTLRRLVLEAPPSLPRRRLARALGLSRGQTLPEGIEVDVELELEQLLRQMGYPDAQVEVRSEPVPGRRPQLDLHAAIRPNDPVVIAFRGAEPPAGSRPLVTSLYRSGLWEEQALEEMRRAAVRVWRSLGYPSPRVEVTALPATATQPRTVTVTSTPGRRLDPLPRVRVDGVPEEVAEAVAAAFAGTVERMELAAGVWEAEQRVLAILAGLGYPAARLLSRTLDAQQGVLALQVAPATRRRWDSVEVVGAPPQDAAKLGELVALSPGDPARRDAAAAAAMRIAEWYRSRGFTEVRVRPVVTPSAQDPAAETLTFEVETGRALTVTAFSLVGSRRTSPSFAARLAGVAARQPLRLDLLREGRRRLQATGLFEKVSEEVHEEGEGSAKVLFHVEERPSVSVAYGVRWESSLGASAVVDYQDRHLLGRALTFGARLLSEPATQAGRLYLGAPDVWGSGVRSEAFLDRRRHTTAGEGGLPDLVEDSTRLTFQLSRPLAELWSARLYGRWQRTHLFERTDFFPLDITLTLPYLGLGVSYDSRDDRVLARRGLFLNLDLSGTSEALGSDLSFLRLFAQGASFVPLGQLGGRPLTWAQSVRLGVAETGSGEELIRSERFFAGGAYSVRGYPTESLGPVEDLGFTTRPLGGAALLVLNQELRLALPRDLTGLLFLDAGQVWEQPRELGLRGLAVGVGVGVRAATPLGVLRLDAAFPLDRRPQDPSYKLYLGFGSVF